MDSSGNQEEFDKEMMDAILQVVEGGNPEEIAAEAGMDPQQLVALSDAYVKQTYQSLLGDAAHRKIGRNEPCVCGSGKKYKKCCLRKHEKVRELMRGSVEFSQPEADESPPEYVVKGFDLLAAGEHEQAVDYANDLLSTYPEDDRIHDTLASAYLSTGQFNQAIEICRSRWQVAKEEKSFYVEHGHHQRLPQDDTAGPPHFYSPETWLEKYWVALKANEYSSLLPEPQDAEINRLIAELQTANDLERFPGQQEKGLEERREALAPTIEQLEQVGPDAIPYLLQMMSQFSWAALFVPDILAHYSTEHAIRSLIEITMFNYHFVSEACLKRLEMLGAEVLPYIRDAFSRNHDFDELKVGFINMLSNLDAPGVDDFLLELLDNEKPGVVDWAGLVLGKRKRVDLLPALEQAIARIGEKPRISWAINHLEKIKEGKE